VIFDPGNMPAVTEFINEYYFSDIVFKGIKLDRRERLEALLRELGETRFLEMLELGELILM
jgi:hypothetical protein